MSFWLGLPRIDGVNVVLFILSMRRTVALLDLHTDAIQLLKCASAPIVFFMDSTVI
jgi:hypothetical protein